MTIPLPPEAPAATVSYIEHVAIRVRDIHWHIRFFHDVLGHTLREVDGTPEQPRQYWTLGGLQLMAAPDFAAPPSNDAGWLAHLGIMVENLEAALLFAQDWGVSTLPQGNNWLQLPDGLAIELIQASPGSVRQALAVNPRAV
jgi:catechol 2,3-dioxygenase-like lactoylglutathione lyase family enzyme